MLEQRILDRILKMLPLLTVVVLLLIGGVRIVDVANATTKNLQVLEYRLSDEVVARQTQGVDIRASLATIDKSTQIELTKIQIQLVAIDTHLIYIRKNMDGGAK